MGNEKENENKNDNDISILVAYLKSQNVTIKILKTTPCTYYGDVKRNYGENVCLHPYSYLKKDWSRFAIARDWLLECTECGNHSHYMNSFNNNSSFKEGEGEAEAEEEEEEEEEGEEEGEEVEEEGTGEKKGG